MEYYGILTSFDTTSHRPSLAKIRYSNSSSISCSWQIICKCLSKLPYGQAHSWNLSGPRALLCNGLFVVGINNSKLMCIAWSPGSQALQQQTASTNDLQITETLRVHHLPSMFLQNKHLALSDNRSFNKYVLGFQHSKSPHNRCEA